MHERNIVTIEVHLRVLDDGGIHVRQEMRSLGSKIQTYSRLSSTICLPARTCLLSFPLLRHSSFSSERKTSACVRVLSVPVAASHSRVIRMMRMRLTHPSRYDIHKFASLRMSISYGFNRAYTYTCPLAPLRRLYMHGDAGARSALELRSSSRD